MRPICEFALSLKMDGMTFKIVAICLIFLVTVEVVYRLMTKWRMSVTLFSAHITLQGRWKAVVFIICTPVIIVALLWDAVVDVFKWFKKQLNK